MLRVIFLKRFRFSSLLLLLSLLIATALPAVGAGLYRRFLTKDQDTGVTLYHHETESAETLSFDSYLLGVALYQIDKSYSEKTLDAALIALKSASLYLKGACRENCGADADFCTCDYSLPYTDRESYIEKHGSLGQKTIDAISGAIVRTRELCLVYEDSYALGLVHKSSNITTQSAYEVLGREYPYLECVITPEKADFSETIVLEADLLRRLGEHVEREEGSSLSPSITLGRTGLAERVSLYRCEIDAKVFAEIFSLKSMCFEIEEAYGGIIIRSFGEGHGLGLSLEGAEKMISDGFDTCEVLLYYFRGCSISESYHS